MEIKAFQKKIWNYYKKEGRHDLPWRKTIDPYKILISEIMLQQTQVDRVMPKYKAFLKAFPNVKALAQASNKDVLLMWSGLGYNRRALFLKRAAEHIALELRGRFPKDMEELRKLPGVGPYTAGAIASIVYQTSVPLIETNIRTVYIHEFFPSKRKVSDKELMPLIEKTLDGKHAREWFYALMDYGVHLKKTVRNPSQRSAHHAKQSPFEGSLRQMRGAIIRIVTAENITKDKLLRTYKGEEKRKAELALVSLAREGFIAIGPKGDIDIK